jgi:hypothetical protein
MFECDKNPTAKYPTPQDLGMEDPMESNEEHGLAGLPFFEEGARFFQAYEDMSRVNLDFDLEAMQGVPLADDRGKLQPVLEIEVPSSPDFRDFDSAFSCASTASPKERHMEEVQVKASTVPIPSAEKPKRPRLEDKHPDMDEKIKRRLRKNRESAATSRKNKKETFEFMEAQVKTLKETVTGLEEENKNIRLELAKAEQEIISLNTQLNDETALRSEREIKKWMKTR